MIEEFRKFRDGLSPDQRVNFVFMLVLSSILSAIALGGYGFVMAMPKGRAFHDWDEGLIPFPGLDWTLPHYVWLVPLAGFASAAAFEPRGARKLLKVVGVILISLLALVGLRALGLGWMILTTPLLVSWAGLAYEMWQAREDRRRKADEWGDMRPDR
jgi:hypothetical protein